MSKGIKAKIGALGVSIVLVAIMIAYVSGIPALTSAKPSLGK